MERLVVVIGCILDELEFVVLLLLLLILGNPGVVGITTPIAVLRFVFEFCVVLRKSLCVIC